MIKEADGQIEEDDAIRTDWSRFTEEEKLAIKLYLTLGDKLESYRQAFFPDLDRDNSNELKKSLQRSNQFWSKPIITVMVQQIQKRAIREAQIKYNDIVDENIDKIVEAQMEIDRVKIDATWVLRRAALLADFNIIKFIKVHKNGDAVYDFSTATDDDWYCIAEYATDIIMVKKAEADPDAAVPVEKLKLKTYDKLKALELVGKHMDVNAFRERIEVANPEGESLVITNEMELKEASKIYQDLIHKRNK